jgi:gliding motility associated protien GldN
MKLIRYFSLVPILSIGINLMGQTEVQQLPWKQHDWQNAKPLEYEYQREADVFWSKTIWRVIDVREKMNLPFAYPQQPLIKIIHEAAMHGLIKAYDASALNADQFTEVMDTALVAKQGVTRDTFIQPDVLDPDKEDTVTSYSALSWEKITKYRIKEVWFFDSKTSMMKVRIMGIAPVMEDYDANGNYRGDMTMYWVYYPDLRDMLAKKEVFNPQNDWQHISWDDLFEMRMFQSYIYKESNVFDRNIQEYATGVDAQLESDRIKKQIMDYESDLWDY